MHIHQTIRSSSKTRESSKMHDLINLLHLVLVIPRISWRQDKILNVVNVLRSHQVKDRNSRHSIPIEVLDGSGTTIHHIQDCIVAINSHHLNPCFTSSMFFFCWRDSRKNICASLSDASGLRIASTFGFDITPGSVLEV